MVPSKEADSFQVVIWTDTRGPADLKNLRAVLPTHLFPSLQVPKTSPSSKSVFISLISSNRIFLFPYLSSSPTYPPRPLHTHTHADAHTIFCALTVIDGVKQQNTEQRVANSPRQPASEGKGEAGVRRRWRRRRVGIKRKERGEREGRIEEGSRSVCVREREGSSAENHRLNSMHH